MRARLRSAPKVYCTCWTGIHDETVMMTQVNRPIFEVWVCSFLPCSTRMSKARGTLGSGLTSPATRSLAGNFPNLIPRIIAALPAGFHFAVHFFLWEVGGGREDGVLNSGQQCY